MTQSSFWYIKTTSTTLFHNSSQTGKPITPRKYKVHSKWKDQNFEKKIMNIPIVSLEALANENSSKIQWDLTAKEFGKALENVGFVYLSQHGISEQKIQNVFQESVKFFDLEVTEKMKYKRDFETTFHGYTQVGGELMDLNTSLELREMFDAALADTGDFSTCPYPDEKVPEFQSAMKELMKECKIVTMKLLKLLAMALGMEDENYFIDRHQNVDDSSIPNFTQLRTLHYPIVEGRDLTPQTVRCAAHTDYGTITLLFQDSVGGLQVKCIDGSWLDAKPIPGCILINVGDLMHIWSDGRFPSTIHRVIIPEEEVKRKKPRQSVALFVKPDNSTLVTPLIQHKKENGHLIDNPYLPKQTFAGEHFQKRTVYHQKIAKAG